MYCNKVLVFINLIFLLINRASFVYAIKLKKIIVSMADNLYEIDLAMNMIKEEVIRELSESVSKQNKKSYFHSSSSKNLSFSEKASD